MAIRIKVNDATVISNSTIEDTDLEDATVAIAIRSWFVEMINANPTITKIECEVIT